MEIDEQVALILKKISEGEYQEILADLDGSDFGLYLPIYNDKGTIRFIPPGYSQLEDNLSVTVSKDLSKDATENMRTIAWLGNPELADSACRHGPVRSCKHCSSHGRCRHCSKHPNNLGTDMGLILPADDLDAPELNYDVAVAGLERFHEILQKIAGDGLGLTLLHGHNSASEFTQLPSDRLSVVAGDRTQFRDVDVVKKDASFVPNIWRLSNGSLQLAGGYSEQ